MHNTRSFKDVVTRKHMNAVQFLAHLSQRLMGALIVNQSLWRPSVNFFKHLLLWNHWANWTQISYEDSFGFVQMVLVTWPRWLPCPYMVKTLKKSSSPEPEGRWPWDLVCSIWDVRPTKFVQMMILCWPWPTLCQCQFCFLMQLNDKCFGKLIFWLLLKPKSLFLLHMLT